MSTLTKSQQREIESIKKHLKAHNYRFREVDGCVIVRDPYSVSGPEGLLQVTGYNNVALCTYAEALRFISDRS